MRKGLKALAVLFWPAVAGGDRTSVAGRLRRDLCRGKIGAARTDAEMSDPTFWRAEANTYLTYPEWHIVYAYDGLAETLKTTDEYGFDYLRSIGGFWSSTCQMMRYADAHGGADGATRLMVHTIGVSFTLEMMMKAAYEETFGRLSPPSGRGEDAAGSRRARHGRHLCRIPPPDPLVQVRFRPMARQHSTRRRSPTLCAAGSAGWRWAANGAPRSPMPGHCRRRGGNRRSQAHHTVTGGRHSC